MLLSPKYKVLNSYVLQVLEYEFCKALMIEKKTGLKLFKVYRLLRGSVASPKVKWSVAALEAKCSQCVASL